jgi:hypothetical protein
MSDVPSVTTLERLINRENGRASTPFFRADTSLSFAKCLRKAKRNCIKSGLRCKAASTAKQRQSAKKAHERKRKPYDLKATKPEKIIEFDMKQRQRQRVFDALAKMPIYLLEKKYYAFCAIDPFKKETLIHTIQSIVRCVASSASSSSSANAKAAPEKVIRRSAPFSYSK